MAQASKRTRPLDRDGDGKDGGSLPGNKTAPMAGDTSDTPDEQTAAVDDLADARTMPGDSAEKLEAIERETDEANAAARTADEPNAEEDDSDDPHASCDRCAEEHPEGVLDGGLCPVCVDEEDDEDEALAVRAANPVLAAIAEVEPELVDAAIDDHADAADTHTFDAEQVEAASQPLTLSLDQVQEALASVAPVVVKLSDLQELTSSNFLYKSPQGYSPTYAAPYVSEAAAAELIAGGLATFDEQAGNCGALRPLPAAREALADMRRLQAAD